MGFSTSTCTEFVEVLASKAPVPGGGGASALVAAVGTALGNMVGSLTVGKKKYADVEDEMWELKAKCDQLQKDFLRLIERDAEVFEPVLNSHLSWYAVAGVIMRPRQNGTGYPIVLLGPCFRWGLQSPSCRQDGGKLLPCLSTLTRKAGGLFLLHCPWSRLRRPLTGTLPYEARTFLTCITSATVRLTH